MAIDGRLDEIPADILIPHYRNLKMIASDNIKGGEATDTTKGMWVFGKSGSGKTSTVWKLFPDAFPKN